MHFTLRSPTNYHHCSAFHTRLPHRLLPRHRHRAGRSAGAGSGAGGDAGRSGAVPPQAEEGCCWWQGQLWEPQLPPRDESRKSTGLCTFRARRGRKKVICRCIGGRLKFVLHRICSSGSRFFTYAEEMFTAGKVQERSERKHWALLNFPRGKHFFRISGEAGATGTDPLWSSWFSTVRHKIQIPYLWHLHILLSDLHVWNRLQVPMLVRICYCLALNNRA